MNKTNTHTYIWKGLFFLLTSKNYMIKKVCVFSSNDHNFFIFIMLLICLEKRYSELRFFKIKQKLENFLLLRTVFSNIKIHVTKSLKVLVIGRNKALAHSHLSIILFLFIYPININHSSKV